MTAEDVIFSITSSIWKLSPRARAALRQHQGGEGADPLTVVLDARQAFERSC